MENSPRNNQESNNYYDIPETPASKTFYEYLERFEINKKIAADPNASEEERQKALGWLTDAEGKLEKALDGLDIEDRKQRGEMAAKAAQVAERHINDIDTDNSGSPDDTRIYVNQEGMVSPDPSIKNATGTDNWVSHEDK